MSSIVPVIAALGASLSLGGSFFLGQDAGADRPLVVVGAGPFDVFDNAEQDRAVDVRFEYRFGSPFFLNLKPFVALEGTGDWGGGAFAGLVADWSFHHWVLSPSFGVGLWGEGTGKDMGSAIEFRSQLEAGYRFDNGWRLTGALGHISNANLDGDNPGAEIATLSLQIPAEAVLP